MKDSLNELHPTAPLSAYEKAAEEGVDPRCIPQYLDGPVPVGSDIVKPVYSDQHNENWKHLFNRQMDLLPGRAGEAYMHGVHLMGMNDGGIPALADLSNALNSATGWQVGRIPGLLHEKDFFDLISKRIFPSTDYIRKENELDYTPAPDCFHDMFGPHADARTAFGSRFLSDVWPIRASCYRHAADSFRETALVHN